MVWRFLSAHFSSPCTCNVSTTTASSYNDQGCVLCAAAASHALLLRRDHVWPAFSNAMSVTAWNAPVWRRLKAVYDCNLQNVQHVFCHVICDSLSPSQQWNKGLYQLQKLLYVIQVIEPKRHNTKHHIVHALQHMEPSLNVSSDVYIVLY